MNYQHIIHEFKKLASAVQAVLLRPTENRCLVWGRHIGFNHIKFGPCLDFLSLYFSEEIESSRWLVYCLFSHTKFPLSELQTFFLFVFLCKAVRAFEISRRPTLNSLLVWIINAILTERQGPPLQWANIWQLLFYYFLFLFSQELLNVLHYISTQVK